LHSQRNGEAIMARVFVSFTLILALTAGVAPKSPPAENTQNTNKRDTAHRQARIQFQYEEIRERKWETKSVGQVFHYGQESEVRSLRGMIVLEVPDEDLLHSFEAPGTPITAPAQSPRITIWNYMGPNKLFPQGMDGAKLEVGDRAKIIQCTGSANYRCDYESNDKGLEEHSKTQWRWYKTTRNALGTLPLTQAGSGTNWSIGFNSQDGLDYFRYSVLPIPVTEKEVTDDKISTRELSEGVELVIPLLKAPVEKGWVFSRRMDARGLEASGTLGRTLTDGSTVHGSLRVMVDLDPAQYVCLITPPENYRGWIPEGGKKDEEQVGNTLQFKGEIRCVSGDPAPDRQIWVEVRVESSTQPGVCVNFPAKGKKTADLVIQREGTSETLELKPNDGTGNDDAWSTATGNFKVGQSFTVKVGSRDFGSFGSIHFNSDIPVRIEGFRDPSSLDLPFDENHNHIADRWEVGQTAIEATADTDSLPAGNGVGGDGLSQYEEYRGFLSKGAHIRTDPIQKDLFIYDPGNLDIGLFGKSGLTVHFVDKDEFDQEAGFTNTNVINGNRDFAALGPQHLLRLANMRLKGKNGWAMGSGPGTPKEIRVVAVDVAKCRAPDEDGVAPIIAHELGHASNLRHHGETDHQAFDLEELRPGSGLWKPTEYAGKEDVLKMMVAAKGGEESGVEECIMRYRGTAFVYEAEGGDWRWHRQSDREEWVYGKLCPDTGPRTIICTQKTGTGVNAPDALEGPMAGNAKKGECLNQFQVNDLKPVK
jgi:hypothetical protein